MKLIILFLIIAIIIVGTPVFIFLERGRWFWKPPIATLSDIEGIEYKEYTGGPLLKSGLELLKARRNNEADDVFDRILINNPNNVDALWGKAETSRRNSDFEKARVFISRAIEIKPKHVPSLVTLAYLNYKKDNFKEALRIIDELLSRRATDYEARALAYVILGKVNARRWSKGSFISKIRYNTQIECYFLRAKEIAPDSAEVRMALGTFYLLAPAAIGGNINKAFEEVGAAIGIAPDYASANARLAQMYLNKGNYDKYSFFIKRAKQLDPQNEVLRELGEAEDEEP